MEVKLFEQGQDLEYTHSTISSPAFLDLAAVRRPVLALCCHATWACEKLCEKKLEDS